MDPVIFRGLERLIIAFGAIFVAYLGYKLFIHGKEKGKGNIEVKSALLQTVVSGQGPGLFFMVFGASVLALSVLHGGAQTAGTKTFSENDVGAKQLLDIRRQLKQLATHNQEEIAKLRVQNAMLEQEKKAIHESYSSRLERRDDPSREFHAYFQQTRAEVAKMEAIFEKLMEKRAAEIESKIEKLTDALTRTQ